MGHHQLDTLDEQILKLIADNARIPFLEVARACNVSGAAIHQRIQKLTNLGILKGSEYIIDPEKIGYETCAYIGIYLKDPSSSDAVIKALENIPEIVECHITLCTQQPSPAEYYSGKTAAAGYGADGNVDFLPRSD